jgi:hypothetical protein
LKSLCHHKSGRGIFVLCTGLPGNSFDCQHFPIL